MSKILIIITKGEIGGAQEVVLQLAKGLHNDGNSVVVGFGDGSYLKKELLKNGIQTYEFKNLKRTNNPISNILFGLEVKKYLDTHQTDTLFIHSSNALFSAWGAKKSKNTPKIAFTFHGMSFLSQSHGNFVKRWIYKTIFKYLLSFVDISITISDHDKNAVLSMGLHKNTIIIPNGISLGKKMPKDSAQKIISQKIGGIDLSKKIVIGSIGRLAYPKNYEFLIKSMETLVQYEPDIICIIIGDGPEKRAYKKKVMELNLNKNIFFTGEIENAASIISAFDIFALVSLYEGSPITIIEAMNTGIPVVSSSVGGVPELLDNDEVQLFKSGDFSDFQDRIMYFIKNKREKENIGKKNKERSAEYSAHNMITKYKNII